MQFDLPMHRATLVRNVAQGVRLSPLHSKPSWRMPWLVTIAVLACLSQVATAQAQVPASPTRAAVAEAAETDLKFDFDELGLSRIVHRSTQLMGPENHRAKVFHIVRLLADGKQSVEHQAKPLSYVFDSATRIGRAKFPWGWVEFEYVPGPGRLDVAVRLHNEVDEPVIHHDLLPMSLNVPVTPSTMTRPDDLGLLWSHPTGTVALLRSSGPSIVGINSYQTRAGVPAISVVKSYNPPAHPVVDNKWFTGPFIRVERGQTLETRFALVFGPAGAERSTLLARDYQRQAAQNPMLLRWPDRRPMGMVFMSHPYKQWKTNPRGYNFGLGEKHDVFTEQGLETFGKQLMQYADTCIANLKAADAQGVIIWNLEGEERPHAVSYVGDPRMLSVAAPEMERFADAFMAKFRDAGFKTGLTIRPTEFFDATEYGQPGQPAAQLPPGTPRNWRHREVKDPVALMSDKIAYAKKRWGTTIFYLDSNVFGNDWLKLPPNANIPWVMPTNMLEAVHRQHPDCLVIPEWSNVSDYTVGAPYSSPNLRQGGTSPVVRALWPEAFRAIAVGPGLVQSHYEDFLQAVRGGDVLMFTCWYPSPDMAWTQLVSGEATLQRASEGKTIATSEDLVKLAESTDPAIRYALARALQDRSPDASARAAAAILIGDSVWPIRRRALASLTKLEPGKDAALIKRLADWTEKPADAAQRLLRGFAADALAAGRDEAVPKLLEILLKPSAEPKAIVLSALGKTGTQQQQARTVVTEMLVKAQDPKEPGNLLQPLVKTAGSIGAKESVPTLIGMLNAEQKNQELREETIVALGKLSDARAVDALMAEWAYPYGGITSWTIWKNLDTALRSVTSETTVQGREGWRTWYERRRAATQPQSSDGRR
jgi:hypothetical protein